MSRRAQGFAGLAALLAAAVALVGVELANGALDYGESATKDPCTAEVSFPGEGLDPTIQRIALAGLNGAACELGATREELVLSFAPEVGTREIPWDQATIERALRAGLLRAVDDAEARGELGELPASLLREVIRRAPLDWLIRGGSGIGELLGQLDAAQLERLLADLDPSVLLDLLGQLEPEQLEDLLGQTGAAAVVEVLRRADPEQLAGLLQALEGTQLGEFVQGLDLGEIAKLLEGFLD